MTKRNIFAELKEGFAALADERASKVRLSSHPVEAKPAPVVTVDEVLALRQRLNLSRAICAPTSAPWKTGSRAARAPTRRPPC